VSRQPFERRVGERRSADRMDRRSEETRERRAAERRRGAGRRDLDTLLDVTRRLMTVTDLDALLRLIAEATVTMVGSQRATIYIVDRARQELWSRVATGSGVGELFAAVRKVYAAATRDMSTPELTRVLEAAIESHQPPLVSGRRIKLRYAHQGGRNPPVVVIHGNQTDRVPDAYRRYLVNVYRKAFDLMGTPVRVTFRGDENPYAGKRNPLTPRQVRKRKRLVQRNKR